MTLDLSGEIIIRPKAEECFVIRKNTKGGYVISSAFVGNDDLEGKILIEPDVDFIVYGNGKLRSKECDTT